MPEGSMCSRRIYQALIRNVCVCVVRETIGIFIILFFIDSIRFIARRVPYKTYPFPVDWRCIVMWDWRCLVHVQLTLHANNVIHSIQAYRTRIIYIRLRWRELTLYFFTFFISFAFVFMPFIIVITVESVVASYVVEIARMWDKSRAITRVIERSRCMNDKRVKG